MLNRFWSKCIECGYPIPPGEGTLMGRRPNGGWNVRHTEICGQARDAKYAEIKEERQQIMRRYGPDMRAWLSEYNDLYVHEIVYESSNFIVHRATISREPGKPYCVIHDVFSFARKE